MNLQAVELELTRYMLFSVAVSVLGFMITMWVLYMVIKNAIRDGIRESGLVQTWAESVASVGGPFAPGTKAD